MRWKALNGIREQLRNQLLQGRDIHGLAMALTLGILLGLIPLLGVSTAICALLATLLRLNHLLIQAANYLIYPLQLMLIIPFIRFGESITGISVLPDSFDQMRAHFRMEGAAALLDYFSATAIGILAWLLVSIPLGFLLYYSLRHSLPKMTRKQTQDPHRG